VRPRVFPNANNNMYKKIAKKVWNNDTHLGVDLKTQLSSDRKMKTGKGYQGVLRRDSDPIIDDFLCRDAHFTFTETLPWSMKRNPKVFNGKYISATLQDDGNLRLNFKPLKIDGNFSVDRYCLGVYNEVFMALCGRVEKG